MLPNILRKVRFGTLDELYASIGYGGTTAVKSVARIKDELLRLGRLKAEKAAAAARTTAAGLFGGSGGRLFPSASATRAEAAQVVSRVLELA